MLTDLDGFASKTIKLMKTNHHQYISKLQHYNHNFALPRNWSMIKFRSHDDFSISCSLREANEKQVSTNTGPRSAAV